MNRPRISIMGEYVDYDQLPDPLATHPGDYFRPVKLSPHAINQASRIVPTEIWFSKGIYTWLQERADEVYKALPIDKTEGVKGKLKYKYEYDADGPVLKSVCLV